jgi:acetyltransferase-like isoleucine patch superfamily enzyme
MDLLVVGPGALLDTGLVLQGHTIEQHTLQLRTTRIEAGAHLGTAASLLPGVVVEAGATVQPLSLVLKGEVVGQGSTWGGLPAAPQATAPSRLW